MKTNEALMVNLTPRESDIVRELLQGASNKEIGYRLNITEGTTKIYLFNLANKLHIRSRLGIALWAERSGAFKPSSELHAMSSATPWHA